MILINDYKIFYNNLFTILKNYKIYYISILMKKNNNLRDIGYNFENNKLQEHCFLGIGCSEATTTTTNTFDQEISTKLLNKTDFVSAMSDTTSNNTQCTVSNNSKINNNITIGGSNGKYNIGENSIKSMINFSCLTDIGVKKNLQDNLTNKFNSNLNQINDTDLLNKINSSSTAGGFSLGDASSNTNTNNNVKQISRTEIQNNFSQSLSKSLSDDNINKCISTNEAEINQNINVLKDANNVEFESKGNYIDVTTAANCIFKISSDDTASNISNNSASNDITNDNSGKVSNDVTNKTETKSIIDEFFSGIQSILPWAGAGKYIGIGLIIISVICLVLIVGTFILPLLKKKSNDNQELVAYDNPMYQYDQPMQQYIVPYNHNKYYYNLPID